MGECNGRRAKSLTEAESNGVSNNWVINSGAAEGLQLTGDGGEFAMSEPAPYGD